MNPLNTSEVCHYVNEQIVYFHQRRLASLQSLTLGKLLSKNPYLFKAKFITEANQLICELLDAFLSSSEEKLFGDFLEGLAIFVAQMTCGGHKSTAPGMDLEFSHQGTYYLVSIKSGSNWGNSSQHSKLEQDFKNAIIRLKQNRTTRNIQPVLGICYGKTRSSYLNGYLKVVGQNFWYLISENKALYTDIIEPIGYEARRHNEFFAAGKGAVINCLTAQFIKQFCFPSGEINWPALVAFNSANFDLDSFLGAQNAD